MTITCCCRLWAQECTYHVRTQKAELDLLMPKAWPWSRLIMRLRHIIALVAWKWWTYPKHKSHWAFTKLDEFRRNKHLLGPWRLPISPRDHVWTPNHKPYATAVASPKRALKASMSLETKEKLPLGSHTTMDYLTHSVFQKMMMRIDSYGTPLPYTLTCWGGKYCTRKELFASFNGKLCKETCS